MKCHDPYYRLDKGCVTACPIRFYEVNHIFKQCLHCPAHCENCTGPNNCLTCQSNFKLQDGMCTTKCNVANYYNVATSQCENCSSHCRGCSSASMCSSCGYYILSDGFCFPFCSLGYYPTEAGICVVCPPSCLTCESETMCLECQP